MDFSEWNQNTILKNMLFNLYFNEYICKYTITKRDGIKELWLQELSPPYQQKMERGDSEQDIHEWSLEWRSLVFDWIFAQ